MGEECEYETTTSEPWLNAQQESRANKYSQRSHSGKRSGKKSNSVLFAGETTVGQVMQTQVSLSTLLMFVVAAIALYRAYSCVAQRNVGGYKQINNAVDTSAVEQRV